MTLYDKIIAIYPQLTVNDFIAPQGKIVLQNDSNGAGDYIKAWNHPSFPMPTQEQLDAIK
jgi:XkdW protein